MEITMSVTHYSFFYFILSNLLVFFILPLNYADNGCLEQGESISTISGTNRNTIISPSQKFELGFFTPNGSLDNKGKYLGIWYYDNSHPRVVVWVANRENTVLEFNASLVIKGGEAKVLGINGTTYWSTGSGGSDKKTNAQRSISGKQVLPFNMTTLVKPYNFTNHTQPFLKRGLSLCLKDDGNLILYGTRQENSSWQRFYNPITDTCLPGMSSSGNLILTSWRSSDNPEQGDYTLHQQLNNEGKQLVIVQNGTESYWQSGMTPFDDTVPPDLFHLLDSSDFGSNITIRLVIHFTGQIQFWTSESQGNWLLLWAEPKDRCSLNDACGNFGCCNNNNGLLCKCLPGMDLMNQTLKESCNPSQVLKCIHMGLLCVQEEPNDRPTMSDVVLMLSSNNASFPPPKKPAFSTKKPPSDTGSSCGVKDQSFTDQSFSDMITMSTVGR